MKNTSKLKRIRLISLAITFLLLGFCLVAQSKYREQETESNNTKNVAIEQLSHAAYLKSALITYDAFVNNPINEGIIKSYDVLNRPVLIPEEIQELSAGSADIETNDKEEVQQDIIHVVTSTDSLWYLAIKYYGNPYMYMKIKEYNGLRSNTIIDGQALRIPVDGSFEVIEESVNTDSSNDSTESSSMTYIGEYKITGYDPWCVHCCSTDHGITASGVEAEVGRTIAMKGYDFGTKVYIEGYGYYVVEDTGGFSRDTIDIACNDHTECYDITNFSGVAVYLVEE